MVFLSPSSNVILGVHFKFSLANEMSGQRIFGSSTGRSLYIFSLFDIFHLRVFLSNVKAKRSGRDYQEWDQVIFTKA